MIRITDITDIELFGVYDRGVPGKERVVIKVLNDLNIGEYALVIGMQESSGAAVPLYDHFFWFGVGYLKASQWIHVYTGIGRPTSGKGEITKEDIFNVYWGKEKTVFDLKPIVPVLIKIGEIVVAKTNTELIAQR